MNYYTHLETTSFKVKNSEKFKKEAAEYLCGEDVDLAVDGDGFVLYACNATYLPYQEDQDIVDPIGRFIQENILPGEKVKLTYVSCSAKYTDLFASVVLVTEKEMELKTVDDLFPDLLVEALSKEEGSHQGSVTNDK